VHAPEQADEMRRIGAVPAAPAWAAGFFDLFDLVGADIVIGVAALAARATSLMISVSRLRRTRSASAAPSGLTLNS
jgi:hypothetical protein